MERVKGIEPSYSAWKSGKSRHVFKGYSDIFGVFGPLRSLRNFSLPECKLRVPSSQNMARARGRLRSGRCNYLNLLYQAALDWLVSKFKASLPRFGAFQVTSF